MYIYAYTSQFHHSPSGDCESKVTSTSTFWARTVDTTTSCLMTRTAFQAKGSSLPMKGTLCLSVLSSSSASFKKPFTLVIQKIEKLPQAAQPNNR